MSLNNKRDPYTVFLEFLDYLYGSLNNILTFLSISSIWIGITGFFYAYIIYALIGLKPNLEMCLVVSLVVFSVYSLNKLTDTKEDEINIPERKKFISNRKRIVLFSALSAYVLSIAITILVKPIAIPIVFIPLFTNALYGSKLIPGIPRFKDIPVMKNVFVASTWALIAPFAAVGTICISNGITVIIFYFFLVKSFVNTVLFDMRDVKGDREMRIKTLPVILGVNKTLIVLLAINSTLLFLIPFAIEEVKVLMGIMVLYGYAIIIHFRKRRNTLLLDILADGEWVFESFLYIMIIKFY